MNYKFYFEFDHLIYIAPEVFIILSLLFAVIYFSAYAGRHMSNSYFMTAYYFLGLCIIIAFFLTIILAYFLPQPTIILGGYVVYDSLTLYTKLVVFVLTNFTGLISRPYLKVFPFKAFEYVIVTGKAIASSSALLASFDLAGFFVTMELVSFCLYALAAARFKSPYAVEAALKYLVQGAFISGIFAFGLALLLLLTGTPNYLHVKEILIDSYAIIHNQMFDFVYFYITMLCLLSLPLFKIAAAPFHYWIADVYEGSPLPVTAFLQL
jgi:NADH-quinone oxidoreductase subunit N